MTLPEKQRIFPRLLAKLIEFAYSKGYEITMGECWRSPETAALYAKSGKGIKNSLHCERIAVDLNIFKNGVWSQEPKDYKVLGDYWKGLGGPLFETCWGGDFTSKDNDHYSISDGGRK